MSTTTSLSRRVSDLAERSKVQPMSAETRQMLRRVRKWASPEELVSIDTLLNTRAGGVR